MDRKAFELFAKLEERHWWFVGRRRLYVPLLEHVLTRRLGHPPRNLRVADVGCGVGGFLAPLAKLGHVFGLELDEPALEFAAAHDRGPLAAGRCDQLPLPDDSIDVATLWDVLEHTEDDLAVLREVVRCLRPGGHVAVSVPAYQFLFANNDRVAHHHRRYTRGMLLKRMAAAGLTPVKATYVNVILAPAIIPAVLLLKLKERLMGRSQADANNLSFSTPRPLNALLATIFSGERHLLRHLSAPFGHSLFVVAAKLGPEA